jgi:hypothetical protein
MNNEPVAWLIQAKIWHEFTFSKPAEDSEDVVITPLYTRPTEHELGIAEAIGFDKGYKAATAKTLTDEEVIRIVKRFVGTEPLVHEIEQAILKKASFTCNGFCGEQECKDNQDGCKRIKKASEK